MAFTLRAWGITAGLPQSYIADEYDFVHAGLRMMKGGDLNPHWWFHPPLQRYLAVATYTLVFLAGVPQGRWSHVAQITVSRRTGSIGSCVECCGTSSISRSNRRRLC